MCPTKVRMLKSYPSMWWDMEVMPLVRIRWGLEGCLEKAIHSSILAWQIPWTEKPGGLQSMGLQRVRHNWGTNTHTHKRVVPSWIGLVYLQESQECLLPNSAALHGDMMKNLHSVTQKRALTRTQPYWYPDFRPAASRTVRITFLLFRNHPVYGIFVRVALANCSNQTVRLV